MQRKKILKLLLLTSFLCVLSANENILNAASNNMNAPEEKYETTSSYYDSVSGLASTNLLNELAVITANNHNYYTSYAECKGALAYADASLTDDSKVVAFYGGIDISNKWQPTNYNDSEAWNREHVWCKSLSSGLYTTVADSNRNAGTDIHQLKASVNNLNSTRNNLPYGEVSSLDNELIYKHASGVIHTQNYYNADVFEPRDAIKGDVARILMYMYTHYSNEFTTGLDLADTSKRGALKITNIVSANTEQEAWNLLLKWNKLDPVDSFESARNNYCAKITGVRNPYIDHPEFANMIWDSSYTGSGALLDDSFKTLTLDNEISSTLEKGSETNIVISSDKALEYYSTHSEFISVDNNGKIVANSIGSATILVKYGNASLAIPLKVIDSKANYTVNFYLNNGSENKYGSYSTSLKYDSVVTKPTTDPTRSNYTFMYWSASNNADAKEYDFTKKIEDNINLYAIWKYSVSEVKDGYSLVTDINELAIGDEIIIGSSKYNIAAGKLADNKNYLTKVAANIVSGKLTSEEAEVFTLGKSGDYWTLTTSNNEIIAVNAERSLNAKGTATWTISFDNDGNAIIASSNSSFGSIQYLPSNPRFLNYTTTQQKVQIYKYYHSVNIDIKTTAQLGFNAEYDSNNNFTNFSNYQLRFASSFTSDNVNVDDKDINELSFGYIITPTKYLNQNGYDNFSEFITKYSDLDTKADTLKALYGDVNVIKDNDTYSMGFILNNIEDVTMSLSLCFYVVSGDDIYFSTQKTISYLDICYKYLANESVLASYDDDSKELIKLALNEIISEAENG